MIRMNAEDPSEKPTSLPTPATTPTKVAGTSGSQRSKAGRRNHSATDANTGSKKKEPLKLASLIIAALLAFFFGLATNQSTDTVKGANDCYDALTQYLENVSSDFWELNHGLRMPLSGPPAQQDQQLQRAREVARKYNTEIDAAYLKIKSKCPVTGRSMYLNSSDVATFNNHYDELAKKCFEAPECSDERADMVQRKSADSTKPLIEQAGNVSQWGLGRRSWYAISNPW